MFSLHMLLLSLRVSYRNPSFEFKFITVIHKSLNLFEQEVLNKVKMWCAITMSLFLQNCPDKFSQHEISHPFWDWICRSLNPHLDGLGHFMLVGSTMSMLNDRHGDRQGRVYYLECRGNEIVKLLLWIRSGNPRNRRMVMIDDVPERSEPGST